MNTTVPDKRNAPTLKSPGIPWDHLPLHWSSSDPLIQKTVLGAKLFTYIHVASLRAGKTPIPGEIRGRLLNISYAYATKKNGRNILVIAPNARRRFS
jgi:hypothetical protein